MNNSNASKSHSNQSGSRSQTIKIDGMTCDECVQKVSGALEDVEGITTTSVSVGSATIEADSEGCAAACSAISDAGYKVEDPGQYEDDEETGQSQSGQNFGQGQSGQNKHQSGQQQGQQGQGQQQGRNQGQGQNQGQNQGQKGQNQDQTTGLNQGQTKGQGQHQDHNQPGQSKHDQGRKGDSGNAPMPQRAPIPTPTKQVR